MLGRYDNFPARVHGAARFTYQISTQQLQEAMLHALYQLNRQAHDLKNVTRASPASCQVNFELGIADGITFNFLDKEEHDRIQIGLQQKEYAFRILDFFCATRYHITSADGKRKPLKFDYNLLRFSFYQRNMELFLVHERGIQRIPLEDLITFLTQQINKELKQRDLKTLTTKTLRTL